MIIIDGQSTEFFTMPAEFLKEVGSRGSDQREVAHARGEVCIAGLVQVEGGNEVKMFVASRWILIVDFMPREGSWGQD